MLPEGRCGPGIFQRSVADWPEGTEMRMVKTAADTQPTDGVQQGTIGIGSSSNHKLNRHSRRPAGMQRVSRLTGGLSLPFLNNQLPDPFVVVQGCGEAL